MVPRHPPLPRYDQKRDGNVFAWILRSAQRARQERADAAELEELERQRRRMAQRQEREP
jgi:hypothetical protein